MGFELTLVPEDERLAYIEKNYDLESLIYMGDGEVDAIIFDQVKIAIAPKNARPKALEKATFVTSNIGGQGAVADACEYIKDKL